jgi:hypothetical protein
MRDPTDYAAAYGADPPADAPLKRKLRRLLQQKEGLSAAEARDRARSVLLAAKTGRTESYVATRRPSQLERLRGKVVKKSEETLEERCRTLLGLAPDAALDATPPAEALTPALDETVAREAADALEAAVARASAPDGPSARGDADIVRRALALRADEAVDVVDLTSKALSEGDEEAARRRNAADAERLAGAGLDDDETDAEEAKQPESPTTIKEEDDDSNDVELWWWPQAWAGGAPELNLLVWERAILVEITASMAALATSLAQSAGQDAILYAGAATTVGLILTSLLLPITLLQATKYIDGTWTLAVTSCVEIKILRHVCAESSRRPAPDALVDFHTGDEGGCGRRRAGGRALRAELHRRTTRDAGRLLFRCARRLQLPGRARSKACAGAEAVPAARAAARAGRVRRGRRGARGRRGPFF